MQRFALGVVTLWVGAIAGTIAAPQGAIAQVVSDGTFPSVISSPDGLNFTINNGSRSGNNLFHSFSQFSVPTGGSAVFNNSIDVQNIFSRVTGNTISNINGLIQANGTANLFLLNPNGILFDRSARLNIGGSLIATTASQIQFADGVAFDTLTPSATPLLTMSVPIGLQFGNQAALITNLSTTGLQVKTGQTLALVGGDLLFEGGKASASSGRIELGSVAPNSQVGLTFRNPGWLLNYDAVSQFQTIHLTKSARLDASGSRNAGIQIQGHQVDFQNGSTATVSITGAEPGQGIRIRATESINLVGVSTDGKTQTSLTSTVQASATGQGGNILLETPTLRVWNGARVMTRTFGAGPGGSLNIQANQVDVKGRDATEANTSELTARVETKAKGQGGNVTIAAQWVQVRDGAAIKLRTQGGGDTGNLLIQATNVNFSGRSPKGSDTDVSTNSREEATGSGGTLIVEAEQVFVQGASVRAKTYGAGAAGNIRMQARALTVADSRITTESDALAIGAGGDIQLTADTLQFIEGGQALASTSGHGNAGNIAITVRSLELAGRSPSTTPLSQQGISNLQALSEGQGAAGTIRITTDSLIVRDGASISVSGEDLGNAGNLRIQANTIKLDTGGNLLAEAKAGSQGNITIHANRLLMRHGSNITTNADKLANGGTITIQTPIILGIENSDIVANALQGQGGNIQITTQGLFGLKFRDRLTPENDITASSEFGVNGTVQVNSIGADPNSGLVTLPVDIADPSQKIAIGCNYHQHSSFIVTGRGGIPTAPQQTPIYHQPWQDLRAIADLNPTQALGLTKSAHNPNRQGRTPETLQEATTWRVNTQGKPELMATRAMPPQTSKITCVK